VTSSRVRRGGRYSALAAVGAVAILVSGCGGAAQGDAAKGKQVFAACGGCHTLADAGTKGNIGPNLDDAFRAGRQQGFKNSRFEGTVLRWLQIAQPPMKRDIVTGQDARDVAAYIAEVAGTDADSPVRPASKVPPEATKVTFPH
jgi:mono/diheme cytochrome c family protein